MMQTKSVPVTFKTGSDEGLEEGEFVAYASTFTREPDSYGDVVAKGAFARGIAERKEAGIPLPGLFGHRLDDPDFYVATALEESEDDHGWRIKGKFDMESPKGPHVYRLVKDGRLRELSFAFQVVDSGQVTLADGTKANELRDLDVFEFSFVPIGANRTTGVERVKGVEGDAFTDEEIAALKKIAAREFASAKEEVAANSQRDHELLRVTKRIKALSGAEKE